MNIHLIAFAIPAIFTLIGIEYVTSLLKNKTYFRFSSSVSNISIGIAERLAQLFLAGYFILIFEYIYNHFSIFTIRQGILSWTIVLLLTDFLWYWYHRLSHEVNILWGAHIVHHQSEEYNLTVSLRITIFQSFVRLLFGLLLPLIGFPVVMAMISISVLGIYQFFIHTQFIKKMGILEYVFVTPSHHRAHHGSNDIYLDKNYGGVLIIWDKLFGTFREETEEVRFGLTKQVGSNSFLWLHFHFWIDLWEHVKEAKSIRNKLKLLFGSPDKLSTQYHTQLRERYLSKSTSGKSLTRQQNPRLYVYIYIQLVASLGGLFFLYLTDNTTMANFLISAFIILSVINCGAILEQKRWVLICEISRFIIIVSFVIYLTGQFFLLVYLPMLILFFIEDYSFFKKHYFRRLYKTR